MNAVDNATTRFSNRVEDYARYRPGYPADVLDLLWRKCSLGPGNIVADIGSGTGILTEQLLKNGNTVYAVEPNQEMRLEAERSLGNYVRFRSVAGTAEATGLEKDSVHLITAAQAFHWFKPAAARAEFKRIARPNAWIVLLWNERRLESSAFLRDYEALLQQYGTDYREVNHRHIDAGRVEKFFNPGQAELVTYVNTQKLDWLGLVGRLRSSSYVPYKDEAAYEPMLSDLRRIFEAHNSGGSVQIEYDTLSITDNSTRGAEAAR